MGRTYLPGRFAVSAQAAVINFRKPPYSTLPAVDMRDKNRGEQNCTKTWRRGGDSNPCIKVLQTSPLATWVPRRWELRQPGSCQRKRSLITQPVYAVKKLVLSQFPASRVGRAARRPLEGFFKSPSSIGPDAHAVEGAPNEDHRNRQGTEAQQHAKRRPALVRQQDSQFHGQQSEKRRELDHRI